MSTRRTWGVLRAAVGTGYEPDGLCGDRGEHPAHLHESATLGRFWCTARQADREPGRSQRRVDAGQGPPPAYVAQATYLLKGSTDQSVWQASEPPLISRQPELMHTHLMAHTTSQA